jgi:hypothetical protein
MLNISITNRNFITFLEAQVVDVHSSCVLQHNHLVFSTISPRLLGAILPFLKRVIYFWVLCDSVVSSLYSDSESLYRLFERTRSLMLVRPLLMGGYSWSATPGSRFLPLCISHTLNTTRRKDMEMNVSLFKLF